MPSPNEANHYHQCRLLPWRSAQNHRTQKARKHAGNNHTHTKATCS